MYSSKLITTRIARSYHTSSLSTGSKNSADAAEERDLRKNSSYQPFILLAPSPLKRLAPIAMIREIQEDLEAMESALTERYTAGQAFVRTGTGEETRLGSGRALGRPTSRAAFLMDSSIALVKRISPKSNRRLLTNSWR